LGATDSLLAPLAGGSGTRGSDSRFGHDSGLKVSRHVGSLLISALALLPDQAARMEVLADWRTRDGVDLLPLNPA
jgi:hypothetical protein